MHHPGEVWYLPPEVFPGGDPKGRRHLLLTRCEDENDHGIFAHATRSATEPGYGATAYLLNPDAQRYRTTGFDAPTYIVLSRLVCALAEQMTRKTGRIVDAMPVIRTHLHRALGIGTGTRYSGKATGGLRGSIVKFTPAVAHDIDATLGLLVTEPRYSLQRRYQLVLPLLDPAEYEADEFDFTVTREMWVGQHNHMPSTVLIALRLIQSVFHPTDIGQVLPVSATAAMMEEIDRKLLVLFEL